MGVFDGGVAFVTGRQQRPGCRNSAPSRREVGANVVVAFGNDAGPAERLIASLPETGHRASRAPHRILGAIEGAQIGMRDHPGGASIVDQNLEPAFGGADLGREPFDMTFVDGTIIPVHGGSLL